MQNYKTKQFIRLLRKNGFEQNKNKGKGSHVVFESISDKTIPPISFPASDNEVNGCMVKRFIKEYNLK